MEKFSRFVDKEDRLFILISKWASVKIVDGKVNTTPTTCDLLEVEKEKLVTVKGEPLKVSELQELINSGKLRKIK